MIPKQAHIFAVTAATIFACGAAALFSGCKGNTTSASVGTKHTTEPPNVTVLPTPVDPRLRDPLSDKVWMAAPWYNLVPPSNTSKSTPAVRAAMLYDAQYLYVAFVSDTVPPPSAPIMLDTVSVYLDSTSEKEQGTEIAHVSVSSTGQYQCNWIRATTPAKAKDDGTPDWFHPYRTFPNQVVPGLTTRIGSGMQNGSRVWTAVVAIPVMSLKTPLQQPLTPGMKWKINLVRSISTKDVGMGTEQLQANLSPVYVGAQAVSPYRMAKLLLAAEPARK
jgi:hypothetical protein